MPSLYRVLVLAGMALFGTICCLNGSPARSAQRPVEITGTVIGYDNQQGLLQVNSRLGTKRFFVRNTTLILLNNHTSTVQNITAGDKVVVDYDYATTTATTIRIIRKSRATGTVLSATSTTINVRLSNGAVVAVRPDAASSVELEGIPLTSNAVLQDRHVTVVYEPSSLLLLSLTGSSRVTRGTLAEVDADANLITLSGGSVNALTVDENATILRNGEAISLGELTAGDRVRIAQIRDGAVVRALAIEARGTTTTASRARN